MREQIPELTRKDIKELIPQRTLSLLDEEAARLKENLQQKEKETSKLKEILQQKEAGHLSLPDSSIVCLCL